MKYNQLGKSDLEVSEICLGTMTFGEQNTEKDAHEQLSFAVENGVNFIDTAELYAVPSRKETQGLTEQYIGSWLKGRQDRDKLILASKIAGPGQWVRHIRENASFSEEHIDEALEGSLRRLQTDYLDLYQLHWPERQTSYFGALGYRHASDAIGTGFENVLRSLKKHVDSGKIRYIGVSNENPWGLMQFLRAAEKYDLPFIVSIQNPYSLLNRVFEINLAEFVIREGIGMMAYSPLAFGMLTGKYRRNAPMPPKARLTLFGDRFPRYQGKRAQKATEMYVEVARAHGLSPAQMALAFVNSRDFVTSNIIGATSLKQLKENIDSVKVQLNDHILKDIEQIHLEVPNPAP